MNGIRIITLLLWTAYSDRATWNYVCKYGKTIKHAVDDMDGKYRETIARLSCATSTVWTNWDRCADVFFEGAANEDQEKYLVCDDSL